MGPFFVATGQKKIRKNRFNRHRIHLGQRGDRERISTAVPNTLCEAVRLGLTKNVDNDSHIVSTSHPANQASRDWHRPMGFFPLPDRSLIRHVRATLQANLEHGHVPEADAQPVMNTLTQIAERLRETEHEHPPAVRPIRWVQHDRLLNRFLVA